MEDTILAYTAGIIDGEGYIGLARNTTAKDSFTPVVKVVSVDEYMVPFMLEHFGGHLSRRRSQNVEKNHRASLEWQLRNAINVQGFLLAIYPYLRVKKAHAEVVISYIQNCPYRKTVDRTQPFGQKDKGRKYLMNPAILESRYDHKARITELNRRGIHLQRLSEEAPNVKSRVKRQSELTGITTVRSVQ